MEFNKVLLCHFYYKLSKGNLKNQWFLSALSLL